MYSNMSMKELKKLHKKFTKKFGKKLFDHSSRLFEERKLVADRIMKLEIHSDLILEWVYRNLLIITMDNYKTYNNIKFKLCGKLFTLPEFCEAANELFELMNTNYYIIWSAVSGSRIDFIFGIIEKYKLDKNVCLIQDEFIHSQQSLLDITIVYKEMVIIRKDMIECRFFNQLQKFYNKDAVLRVLDSQNTYLSIKAGFVKSILHYSDVHNIESLLLKKSSLIEDMLDGAIWLGFGRVISHNDMETEDYHFRNVFMETDNNIGYALLQAMAAWAPQSGTKKGGSFVRFLETASTDLKRATRNLYLYLIDNFYYEDFQNLSIPSKVIIGTALQFILSDGDGTVDFAAIAAKKEDIYAFFQKSYADLVNKLLVVNPILFPKILAEKTASVELELLRMVTNGNEAKYSSSLQEYIIERAKETGIINKNKP